MSPNPQALDTALNENAKAAPIQQEAVVVVVEEKKGIVFDPALDFAAAILKVLEGIERSSGPDGTGPADMMELLGFISAALDKQVRYRRVFFPR
jgi:hypothetical protein